MSQGTQLVIFAGLCAWFACVAFLVYTRTSDIGFFPGGQGSPVGGDAGVNLPVPSILKKDAAPWYVSWSNPGESSVTAQGLRIDLKKDKWSGEGGTQFRANPFKSLPGTHAMISYSVYIPRDFPYNKTGKIGPGFCVSTKAGDCASGGDWKENAGSVRITWAGSPYPGAMIYCYFPTSIAGGSVSKTVAAQPLGPDDAATNAGVHFGRKKPLSLKSGAWNSMTVELKLNDVGSSNGFARLTVNGKTLSRTGMLWRKTGDIKITDVMSSVFFGGGDKSYAPPRDTYLVYNSFGFKKIA